VGETGSVRRGFLVSSACSPVEGCGESGQRWCQQGRKLPGHAGWVATRSGLGGEAYPSALQLTLLTERGHQGEREVAGKIRDVRGGDGGCEVWRGDGRVGVRGGWLPGSWTRRLSRKSSTRRRFSAVDPTAPSSIHHQRLGSLPPRRAHFPTASCNRVLRSAPMRYDASPVPEQPGC
jgi:hypothetical protein